MYNSFAQFDNRVNVIHIENRGLASARNLGLSIAQGSFISFIDRDDWIESETIQILLKAAFEYEADIIVAGICK